MSQNYSFRSGRNGRARTAGNQQRGGGNRSSQSKRGFANINPARFIQSAKPQSEEPYTPVNSFQDFELHELLGRNLEAMGFDLPSPIQDQAIPEGLAGKDIVGIADTGTGKTAAFAVPIINKLIASPNSKAIILAPTRELAQQIEQQCRIIGKGSGINGALLIGGTAMRPQLDDLRYNPKIIIGTPGRVKDHLQRGSLDISDCDLIALDEVDRMLDMGFVHDITQILSRANKNRQSFYFSATLDARVKSIIETFSVDPVHISIKSGDTGANIEQNIVRYSSSDNKVDKLHDVLVGEQLMKTIVFNETHHSVERLSKELISRGFSADSIHGGKTQAQRQRVLHKFKNGEIDILVATDVAARGLDVADITHVINYSLPHSYDDYVHRIGRTGRAGKTGSALTFVEA